MIVKVWNSVSKSYLYVKQSYVYEVSIDFSWNYLPLILVNWVAGEIWWLQPTFPKYWNELFLIRVKGHDERFSKFN